MSGNGRVEMSLGLARGQVRLAPYNSEWKCEFEQEAGRLRLIAGEILSQIEHIGSTSIEGMIAKPIIDLMCVVAKRVSVTEVQLQLAELGYEYRTNGCTSDRIFFARGPITCRTHYLSITESNSQFYKEKLAFRDYLRTHPTAVVEYCLLKQTLAARYSNDRSSYTEGKRAFVEQTLADACAVRRTTGVREEED